MAATCGNGYVFDKLLKKKKNKLFNQSTNQPTGQSVGPSVSHSKHIYIITYILIILYNVTKMLGHQRSKPPSSVD